MTKRRKVTKIQLIKTFTEEKTEKQLQTKLDHFVLNLKKKKKPGKVQRVKKKRRRAGNGAGHSSKWRARRAGCLPPGAKLQNTFNNRVPH